MVGRKEGRKVLDHRSVNQIGFQAGRQAIIEQLAAAAATSACQVRSDYVLTSNLMDGWLWSLVARQTDRE